MISAIQPCDDGVHPFRHHKIDKEEQPRDVRDIKIAFYLHCKSVAVRL